MASSSRATGAGLGAITGFFVKRGVDEDFQNRVRNLLTEKDEAVFMVVNEMTEDKFVDAMRPSTATCCRLLSKGRGRTQCELGKC